MAVVKRVGRRRTTEFLHDLRNRRRYCELKEEAGYQKSLKRQFIIPTYGRNTTSMDLLRSSTINNNDNNSPLEEKQWALIQSPQEYASLESWYYCDVNTTQ